MGSGGGGPGGLRQSSLRPERRPRRSFQPLRFSWSSWLTREMSQLAAASGSSGGATGAMFRGGGGGRRGPAGRGAAVAETASHLFAELGQFPVDGVGAFEVAVEDGVVVAVDLGDEADQLELELGLAAAALVLAGLELAHEPAEDGGLGLGGDQVQGGRRRRGASRSARARTAGGADAQAEGRQAAAVGAGRLDPALEPGRADHQRVAVLEGAAPRTGLLVLPGAAADQVHDVGGPRRRGPGRTGRAAAARLSSVTAQDGERPTKTSSELSRSGSRGRSSG